MVVESTEEEYLRYLKSLQEYRDKFPGQFNKHMGIQMFLLKGDLARLQEQEAKKQKKEGRTDARKARRKGVVSAR